MNRYLFTAIIQKEVTYSGPISCQYYYRVYWHG